jgi:addiction module HigA family antidote
MIMIEPPHPGEIINEDYLIPLGMSVNRLAKGLGIGAARVNEIVRGNGALPRIPRCVWLATLERVRNSG